MNPPPIGEALSEGWRVAKENLGVLVIGMLLTMLVGNIPLVGHMLGTAGMSILALKAVRGQKPEMNDYFGVFNQAVDIIVIGLLRFVGIFLCFIGVFVTEGLFCNGTFFVLDKKMAWGDAKDKCMNEVKPNAMAWIIFYFVIMLSMSLLGTLLCIIGIFVTMPIAFCAVAYAYEKAFGASQSEAVTTT